MKIKSSVKAGGVKINHNELLTYPNKSDEVMFGQIKQARGFRQFLLRGLDQVRAEWAMVCTVHNLLKLHRAAA